MSCANAGDSRPEVEPIERRTLGRTGEQLSIVGMGGMVVAKVNQQEANGYVAEAVDRGVNYFDVGPRYFDAEERLGPALKPHRDRCFLACKTRRRDAAGAEMELNQSLERLQTDHLDLYQFHSMQQPERDVEQIFAPGGAMETVFKAREAGKVRYIGFSAHSEECALAAMDRFDFDSILFPLNYATWTKGAFGEAVHRRATEKGMGILALKGLARAPWPEGLDPEQRKWPKCWYEPCDAPDAMALQMRFTLGLPVTAMIPPSHWELFKIALDIAQSGAVGPLAEGERARLEELSAAADPLFAAPVA